MIAPMKRPNVIAAIGGDFHSGDVAEVETADPAFWDADEFTLNYEVGAVGRAEIPDAAGQFSFTLALFAARPECQHPLCRGGPTAVGAGLSRCSGQRRPRRGADPLP